MNRFIQIFIFGVTALLFLSGCTGDNDDSTQAAIPTKTWVETDDILDLCIYHIDTLNPLKTSAKHNAEVLSILYDSLFIANADFSATQSLAEQYQISSDGMSVTIKIRQGVRFSDNRLLTATDVAFSVNTIVSSNGYYKKRLGALKEAKVFGDSVVITLHHPVENLVMLLDFPILPGGADKMEQTIVPGSSLYTLEKYNLNREIHLKANHNHFSGITPSIENIVIHMVKDQKTAINMLESSRIDMLTGNAANLQENTFRKTLHYNAYPDCHFLFLGANNTSRESLSTMVCEAVSCAIDRAQIIDILGIDAEYATLPIHPNAQALHKNFASIKDGDPDGLLATDGWFDSDSDGVLDKQIEKKKYSLSFHLLLNNDNEKHKLIAMQIKEHLAEIGIKIMLHAHPFTRYQQEIRKQSYDFYLAETDLLPNFDLKDLNLLIGSEANTSASKVIGIYFKNAHIMCDTRIEASNIQTLNPYKSIHYWSMAE
ncbi:MAG: hypothetical protein J6Q27_03990 [Clostridia bacterium]|nr:hypothetical protein [Clostridia bacterium]